MPEKSALGMKIAQVGCFQKFWLLEFVAQTGIICNDSGLLEIAVSAWAKRRLKRLKSVVARVACHHTS
jgi:transposase